MTHVEAEISRTTTLRADRERVWEVLADVSRLDRLMPDVAAYEEVEDGWRWQLEPRRAMGYRIQPRFTVSYEPTPPERLAFEHVPREGDSADSHGAFTLRPVDGGGTDVEFALAVRIDVDVPSLFRGTVRQLLREEVRSLVDGFLVNLRSAVGS